MESLLSLFLLLSSLLIFLKYFLQNTSEKTKLPSTPRSLPIIGHLHLLKTPLPQTLQKLATKYGPIISLRFGSLPVLLVSNSSAMEECFTKNDIIFSNRPKMPSKKRLEYNFTGIAGVSYGPQWRNLRRFTTLEVFSSRRVQMSSTIRTEEIQNLIKFLILKKDHVADVKSVVYMTSFNIMMRMVCGKRYFEGDNFDLSKNKIKYYEIRESFSPAQDLALGDIFPMLSWLSFVGVMRKKNKLHRNRDKFLQGLIDARRNNKSATNSVTRSEKNEPIIDVMLSLQESEPEVYSDITIKGIVAAMLIAGTETSAKTMETMISYLISHPKILKRAIEEIEANTQHQKLLEDGDIAKLSYLQCVINETLRLGPIVPMLPLRESSADCTVGEYHVPRGTMLLVNVRALHTDPTLWDEPLQFIPERFKGLEGQKGNLNFIPFGMGRRQCPGATLAMRLMALTLGTLIQCFEWEKVEGDDLKVKFIPHGNYATLYYST